jgi:YVTN family beta-propeller protein
MILPGRWRVVTVLALWLGLVPALAAPAVAQGTPGSRVYVANSRANTVSVIDPQENRALTTLPVQSTPWGVAVSPDGRWVYVTHNGTGTVSAIETASNEVKRTIRVGLEPRGVAVGSDGKVFVANYGNGTVSVIDPSQEPPVVATVPVELRPEAVAVSPDGRVYVSNSLHLSLSVIDPHRPQPVETARLLLETIQPRGIAITRDGTIYTAAFGVLRNVVLIYSGTHQLLGAAPIGPEFSVGDPPPSLAAAPNGRYVYVADFSGSAVSVIAAEARAEVARIRTPAPQGVAVSPDGRWVYATNYFNQSVSVIDSRVNEVVGTVLVDGFPIGVAVKP